MTSQTNQAGQTKNLQNYTLKESYKELLNSTILLRVCRRQVLIQTNKYYT